MRNQDKSPRMRRLSEYQDRPYGVSNVRHTEEITDVVEMLRRMIDESEKEAVALSAMRKGSDEALIARTKREAYQEVLNVINTFFTV